MSYKKFLWLYASSFIALIIATLMLLVYLSFLFEHNSYETIAKRQIQNNSLYGTALSENYFLYRLKMIELQQSNILAIGSSRIGQFKAKYFNDSFYAASNGANNLSEMEQFIKEVLKIYTPQVVILGLDPWWFNPRYPDRPASLIKIQGTSISIDKIKKAVELLKQKKLPLSLRFFNSSFIANPYIPHDSLGIRAIMAADGTFADGSYFYGSRLYEHKNIQDIKFSDSIWRIYNNHSIFAYGDKLSQQGVETLERILFILQSKNIPTFIFIAPIAKQVFQLIQKDFRDRYGYLFEFFTWAEKRGIDNFFDLDSLPDSNDCELYDGFHAGDVIYARILLEIAKKRPDFAHYLNFEAIDDAILRKKGYAYSGDYPNLKESDFLEIGCKK